MKLGVCYYPEHWPEERWAADAAAMAALGLTYVRIGEFAWSRIEPEFGAFDWGWLDRAVETLHAAGLRVVLGTPTATPPKWLVDARPGMLAVDARGQPRGFGSRRHYCFSSRPYRTDCVRIVTALADRYGAHPGVAAWQTDNEYGCHDTVLSYSEAARGAFRDWLRAKYGTIAALNAAWGTVFWSQEYRAFHEVDPPAGTVTEANPAHRLDYQRFASDEVASFNRLQTDLIRPRSPGRPILHNFMGMFTAFDHRAVAADLDAASWDSYPLGFLDQSWFPAAEKLRYLRQGHPDFTAFHHDLYRGVGRGRWWVMEQQPGPVNWAPHNPAPLPGMVRAWSWEAFAHGAEVVSYFRWRQVPFAQEQMHAGLQEPDGREAPAAAEVRALAAELKALGPEDAAAPTAQAPVALVFDYESDWLIGIQPQGRGFRHLELALEAYRAARRFGWDVDVIGPADALDSYSVVIAPCLPLCAEDLAARLQACGAQLVFGPRAGSKTADAQIPPELPPGPLTGLLGLTVRRVESVPPDWRDVAEGPGGGPFTLTRWLEHVDTDLTPRAASADGHGVWFAHGRAQYLACWPDAGLWVATLAAAGDAAGLPRLALPDDLRLRRRGPLTVALNHGPDPLDLRAHVPGAASFDYLFGGPDLPPAGVAVWRG